MSLENLLNRLVKEGKLKQQLTDNNHLNDLLVAAKRNFDAALIVKGKIDTAREFWQKVRIYLKKKNPQLELFDEF